MEKFKGYRSVVFFTLALILALANMFGFAEFEFTSEQAEWFAVIVPLAGVLLRYISNTPIFQAK